MCPARKYSSFTIITWPIPSTAACSFCFLNCCRAGLFVTDGAESELLASPFAMLNSSSEPIEPDVNLEKKQRKTYRQVKLKSSLTTCYCAVISPPGCNIFWQFRAMSSGKQTNYRLLLHANRQGYLSPFPWWAATWVTTSFEIQPQDSQKAIWHLINFQFKFCSSCTFLYSLLTAWMNTCTSKTSIQAITKVLA